MAFLESRQGDCSAETPSVGVRSRQLVKKASQFIWILSWGDDAAESMRCHRYEASRGFAGGPIHAGGYTCE